MLDFTAVRDVLLVVGGGVLIYGATHIAWARSEIANIKAGLTSVALKEDLAVLKTDVTKVENWFAKLVTTTPTTTTTTTTAAPTTTTTKTPTIAPTTIAPTTTTTATPIVVPPVDNGMIKVINADGTVTWTTTIPVGMIIGKTGALIQPVLPAEAFALCRKAPTSTGQIGYTNGLNWNQAQYLRELDVKTFAQWCFDATKVAGVTGSSASVGWITNLSIDGEGFFLTLLTQNLTIPATDPR